MINETQIGLYKGGNFPGLDDYLDRKIVKPLPFAPSQIISVVTASHALINNTMTVGNIAKGLASTQTSGGMVCAALPGLVGLGSTNIISDTQGSILNLVEVRDSGSNDEIMVSGQKVWGLLQCSNTVTDGDPIGAPTFENIQVSFVVRDVTDTLVITPITGTIEYNINSLFSLRNLPVLSKIGGNSEVETLALGIISIDTVVNAELLNGSVDNDLIYVVETETVYRYEDAAAVFVRDGEFILDTADAGTTRWLGIAGKYHVPDISTMGSLELKEQSSIPPPKASTVKHFASASGGVDINTVFLCHFDTGNGSGVFTDDSLAAHIITPNNGMLQSNVQVKFGQSTGAPDGVNQFLTVGDHTDWNYASGEFTIEAWVYLGSAVTKRYPIYNHKTDDNNFLAFYIDTDRSLNFEYKNTGTKVIDLSGGLVDLYTWTHIVAERAGDDWTIYVNGISKASVNTALALQDFTGNLIICAQDLGEAVSVHGHWHLNETTGSSFPDSSGNGYNGTCVGMLNSDWVTGKLNNGLEFNPTGDYATLGAAGDFERTDPFSVELWFKRDPADTVGYIVSKMVPNIGWGVYISAGKLTFRVFHDWNNDGWSVQADSFTLNTDWHHVIVTYDGSSSQNGVEFHIDGVKETVYSFPISYNGGVVIGTIKNAQALQLCGRTGLSANLGMIADEVVIYDEVISQLYIDYRYNSGIGREEHLPAIEYFDGYIDEYRITNGIARFQGNFVPSGYPYGVSSPYWILPNGSVIGLSGFGQTGSKQWGEDGFDIYRDNGRVDIYDAIGAGKYDTRVTNNTGGTLEKYRLVQVVGHDIPNDIPNVNNITTKDQEMLGIVTEDIINGEQGYIRFRGNIQFGGFDTTIFSTGDPVYYDINTSTPTMSFTSYKIGTLIRPAINGIVHINISTYDRGIKILPTIADAELEIGKDNDVVYVSEIDTFYKYETMSGPTIDDNEFMLSTGDGGVTRWIASTGKYNANAVYASGIIGSGKDEIRVQNNTLFQIDQYKIVRASSWDSVYNIPRVVEIDGNSQTPVAIVTEDFGSGEVGFQLRRGMITAVGFNTSSATIDDPVYSSNLGDLTLTETDMKVGIVSELSTGSGVVYIDIGGGGGGGSKLAGEDEGILAIADVKTINFVGADVSAYQNGSDPNQLDVYIPALAFQPYYDASNPQGNATVPDTTTSSRNVADPAPENLYDIGGWAPGTLHPITRSTPLTWTHTDNCSFVNNTSTTVEVNIYDETDVAILETYTTPAIVGNSVNNGVNITVSITGWAVDSIRWQSKISVTVDIDTILPNSGRWSIEVIHHNGSSDYTYTQGPLFYDTEALVAALTGVSIAETGGSVVTRFISGVEYYDFGSQFTIDIADIDNLNSDSYPVTQVNAQGGEYALPALNIPGASLTGWMNDWNDNNDTYQKTDWAINQLDFFTISTTANVSARVVDWVAAGWINSPNANVLIDTYDNLSTRLIEQFRFENWRCPTTGNFDLPNQKTWTSNIDVGLGDSVFFNGGCERNVTNFTIYNPNSVSQPNYSTQNATVWLYREFMHTGAASSSMRINITGTYTSLEYKLAKVWNGTSSGGTIWVDGLIPYNFAQWNNGSPLGGTGGQTGAGAGYIDVTFGSNNIINTSDTVYVRISFTAGQRITTLNIVFS